MPKEQDYNQFERLIQSLRHQYSNVILIKITDFKNTVRNY